MAVIQRLLCTHCTFGSSELEPSTAENAAKVLGYSVCRSSLPEPDRGPLRAAFRGVERLLSYELPKDTPPASKETLEAQTTPRRLVFMPNLAGWQAAAHVSYRTRDTHGRIGSYFADVIAASRDRDSRPWCPLDILGLWAASHDGSLQSDWWCDSEESLLQRDGDGRWKPAQATSPAELRGSTNALLDDRMLYQFLRLEPGQAAEDPGAIVPPRWWSMPASQRRDLLAALLNAVIQTRKSGGREGVIVACEPSVAAVMFYGVFRLLPPKLRHDIGFSTYEAAPERPLTPLVATTFIGGEASAVDLSPELAAHGFACNTFRDVAKFGRTQPIPADGFVRRAIDLASSAAGWGPLDGFLTAVDALPRPDFRSLDEYARVDAFVTRYVTGGEKLDTLGTEPPVSVGSDGERFRRMRFRELIVSVASSQGGGWPRDLLRTAIRWLGDDFIEAWRSEGPLADALRARLPDGNNGLAKVLDALKAVRTVPADFVRDAVVGVALATDSPELPPAFVDFITPSRDGRRGSGGRATATESVQAVIEGLAARNQLHLIETADSGCVAAICDAVLAWERDQPGRWQQLGLRLPLLVERQLAGGGATIHEQVAFLVEHDGLAQPLAQSDGAAALSQVLDKVFSELLRITTTHPKPLQPGQLLAADGRSRVQPLLQWLCLTPPTNTGRFRERLNAWKAVHDIILRLREPAEKAGKYAKCPLALEKFDHDYELLARDNPGPGSTAAQRMGFFVAKSMDGLKVAESARQTIVRWLVAALADDLDRTGAVGLPSSKPMAGGLKRSKRDQSSKGRNWLYAGILGTVAITACVIAGVAMWQRQSLPQPDIAKQNGAVPGPPPAKQGERVNGDAPTGVLTPDTSKIVAQTALPAPPPVTPQSLKFEAELKGGVIEARWNKEVPPGTTLTLHVTVPSDIPPGPTEREEIADVAAGLKRLGFPRPRANEFGDYAVRITAKPPGKTEVNSQEIKIPVLQPDKPTVRHVTVDVDEQGQPQLHIKITPPDLTQQGACKAILTKGGLIKQEARLSESLTFTLPADNSELTPAKLLAGPSMLKLHYDTDLGSGQPCDIAIPGPGGGDLEAEVQESLARKQSEGISHVCALEETFQPGKQTSLLDLPWWFVDAGLEKFDLDLLPSGKALATDLLDPQGIRLRPTTGNLRKWECMSGELLVGFLEIVNTNPWKPKLVFLAGKPSQDASKDAEQAYARLRTFKLCFINQAKPFGTVQFIDPSRNGPLLLRLPVEQDEGQLPVMEAGVILPRSWAKPELWGRLKLRPVLQTDTRPDQILPGSVLSLEVPVPEKTFVAHLRVSQSHAEVTANVNLKPDEQRPLQIRGWIWTKVPAPDTPEKSAPRKGPVAEKDTVSPKLLLQIAERQMRRDALGREIAEKESARDKEADKKKKAEIDDRLSALRKMQSDLNDERKQKRDDLVLPCCELYSAIVEKDIEISDWQISWQVQPKTVTTGLDVPSKISGGLLVVGAVGVKDGQPPVKFEPEKKK